MDKKDIKFHILEKGEIIGTVSYEKKSNKVITNVMNEKSFKFILSGTKWEDIEKFLISRVFPNRDGSDAILKRLGLEEYDTIAIIRKTKGRLIKDSISVEIIQG